MSQRGKGKRSISTCEKKYPSESYNIEFNCILGTRCFEEPTFVEDHILAIFRLHKDKSLFVAPYLQNGHYSMIIVSSNTKKGYIVDSLKNEKDKDSYLLTSLVERAFCMPFAWIMVNCHQQSNTWECGYSLMRNMFDFVMIYQHNFPNNMLKNTRFISQKDIDDFLLSLVPQFVKTTITGKKKS